MKRTIVYLLTFVLTMAMSTSRVYGQDAGEVTGSQLAIRNVERAIQLVDSVMDKCFAGTTVLRMMDVYDFTTHAYVSGTSDVWPYTAVIEAVNSILESLDALKDKAPELYEQNHSRYVKRLRSLYKSIGYYRGSFTLTSYTRTTKWTKIYGVHRGSYKEGANVEGVENVYDDQMWLVRELYKAYCLTSEEKYLEEAENLTAYVLDGWDTTLDADGNENGGITWGPGYVTKHACSNGPMVSPLVRLSEHYSGKSDEIEYGIVNEDNTRSRVKMAKSEYYLMMAEKVYAWQKKWLLLC